MTSELNEKGAFPLSFLEAPNSHYLRQGDILPRVPLITPASKLIIVADPTREGQEFRGQVRGPLEEGESAYVLSQVSIGDAIVLNYDCDIDRALEAVKNNEAPRSEDLITVAPAIELTPNHQKNLGNIASGKVPRLAYLPGSTKWPARIIDFSSIQQIDIRVIIPLVPQRRFGLKDRGQLRLLEAVAHFLGDAFRRQRGAGGVDDPNLLADAYRVVTGSELRTTQG